jgi:hypothetical protein
MSASLMFLAFKKWITDRISHAAGFLIFLNIVDTQDDVKTWFDCLQMASMPFQRADKLCMRVHHCDRSTAVAVFANGT